MPKIVISQGRNTHQREDTRHTLLRNVLIVELFTIRS